MSVRYTASYLPASDGASANTAVNPGTAALAVTGNAPSVTRTEHQTTTPIPAALAISGNAPVVTRTAHQSLTPGTGALAMTGHAPAVTQSDLRAVSPGPAALLIASHAPSVAQTTTLELMPGSGALVITGNAPTISQSQPATDPRYARPASTISAGAWLPSSGSSLAAMLDEPSADATDFIYTNTPGTVEVLLAPVVDPGTSSGQVFRYQIWSEEGSGGVMRLKQGATIVASWAHDVLPSVPTVFAQPLTGAQCDSITDYADLRLEFTAA